MAGSGVSISDITGGLKDIFGTSQEQATSGKSARKGTTTKQLELSPDAIAGIIREVLGSTEGLASIFGGEQATGLYSSSAATQEAGDLTSRLIAEIAKLQAKEVTAEDYVETSKGTTGQEDKGLIGQVGGLLKGIL